MASLQGIAEGLAANLGRIPGLRAVIWMPDDLKVPCAVVGFPERVEYEQTMRAGKTRWLVPVVVYASRWDAERGQAALAPYFDDDGDRSLRAAIYADSTLGGVADDCILALADRFGRYPVGNVEYVGCVLTVEVWTS